MPRHRGCWSFSKTKVRNRHSVQSKTGIRTMLCSKHFPAYLCLVALLTMLFGLQVQVAQAQNTDDDVHIKPRIEPKPASDTANIKELEANFSPHTRPLKASAELVLVPVTITDPMNRLVTGLDKDNFTVFEGKSQQEIKSFSSEDAPVSLGVIFDMSGSMSSQDRARPRSGGGIFQDGESAGRVLHDHLRGQAGRSQRLHQFDRRHPGQAGVHRAQGPHGAAGCDLPGRQQDEARQVREEGAC